MFEMKTNFSIMKIFTIKIFMVKFNQGIKHSKNKLEGLLTNFQKYSQDT
jgi:hypothetical protein